jgi:AraC-like DNA-binding protein
MSSSRPGYCGRCNGWLGLVSGGASPEEVLTGSEYWVSKTAGDLLALAPRVAGKPGALRRAFRDNVDSCLRHLFQGNGAEFAKFVGCTATSVYNWRSGKTTPRIDQLLQLSDRLPIPIAAFLLAGRAAGAVDWKVVKPGAMDYAIPSILHRSSSKVRQALRLLLDERPAPSLSEVARRLGYQGTEGLRRVSKSLCKRITDNYKKSFEPQPYYSGPRPRICGRQEIEAALRTALAQDEPESVPQIARRLGYAGSGPFFRPFPALCHAIYSKIARRKAARIGAMRRTVERALRQNPPPTLRTLAVQLGYKDKRVLTRYFDEFRAKLLARRRALARSQIAQLRRQLQPYTRMEPAPSMAEACRKLGLKRLTASRKFPAEYQLIVSRYQQRCRTMPRLRQTGGDCDPPG